MMALIPPTKAGYFHGENVALGERAPYIPMKPQWKCQSPSIRISSSSESRSILITPRWYRNSMTGWPKTLQLWTDKWHEYNGGMLAENFPPMFFWDVVVPRQTFKFTLQETNSEFSTWKSMVRIRLLPFGILPIFLGAFAASFREGISWNFPFKYTFLEWIGFQPSFPFQKNSSERKKLARWWFQIVFMFIPIWGRFPIWRIFFRWVETTNQLEFFTRLNRIRRFF